MTANKQYKLDLEALSLIDEKDGKLLFNNKEIGSYELPSNNMASNLIQFKGDNINLTGTASGRFNSFLLNGSGASDTPISDGIKISFFDGLYYDTDKCMSIIKQGSIDGAFSYEKNPDNTYTLTNLNNAFQNFTVPLPNSITSRQKVYIKIKFKSISLNYSTSLGIKYLSDDGGPNLELGYYSVTGDVLEYSFSTPITDKSLTFLLYGLGDAGEKAVIESFLISTNSDFSNVAKDNISFDIKLMDSSHSLELNGTDLCCDVVDLLNGLYIKKTMLFDSSIITNIKTKKIDDNTFVTYGDIKDNCVKRCLISSNVINVRIEGEILSLIYDPKYLAGYDNKNTIDQIQSLVLKSQHIKKILFERTKYEQCKISASIDSNKNNNIRVKCSVGTMDLIAPSKYDFKTTQQLESDHLALKTLVEKTIVPQTVENAMNVALAKYSLKASAPDEIK